MPGQASNRRGFTIFVVALIGVSVLLAAAILVLAAPDPRLLLMIAVLAIVLEASPVLLNEDVMATMSVVAVFLAICLGGVPAAAVAGLAVGLASGWTVTRDRLLKISANVGMHVVSASAAAVTFAAATRVDALAPRPDAALSVEPLWLTGGLLLAATVYTVTNAVIAAIGLTQLSDVPFGSTFRGLVKQVVSPLFLSVGLSAIAYVLLQEAGWPALVFIMVPLLLARRSLQTVQHRQEAFDRMVRTFVKAIELKDGYTRGHAERVSDLSVLVAERMGLTYEQRQLIRYGAILHDVGKIGVSLGILCKAGPLTDDEFDEMKLHPEIGADMLADIDFLQPALSIVHHHHERMDGRGYPAGLVGEEIPLLTRVVTAVDAFDAMTSTRSYRRALPVAVAIGELQANAGTQFDAEVVEHLVAVVAEYGWTVTDDPVAVAPQMLRGVAS